MNSKKAQERISGATTSLILERPFLGVLALNLHKTAQHKGCPNVTIRAEEMYYNPEYVLSLGMHELEFVVSHEVLHCALLHFARRGTRDKQRWNIACDFAVNSILIAENMTPPEGILYNPLFDGMAAEEIYPCLDDSQDSSQTLDQHDWDDDENNETLQEQWRQKLTGALQQAMQANKLSPAMQRVTENTLQPQLPWHALLAQYMNRCAREDYSYIPRPSNRREGPAIYPSLRSGSLNLVVAIDTSSSVSDEDIARFVSEMNGLKSTLHARTTVLACDNSLHSERPPYFEPWDTLEFNFPLHGGGGTSFVPVFRWVEQQDTAPDALVYFTDALGKFPPTAPHFPVLWLVKGKAPVPWGKRISLN